MQTVSENQSKYTTVQRSQDAGKRNLLMLTCMGALDGTILLLAATGGLDSLRAAVVVGLTVVSGAGAWIAASQCKSGWKALLGIAAISTAATVSAAWLGATLGAAVSLHILPKAAGLVLMLIAAEVGGLRLPRIGKVPLPAAALAAGLVLEVLA